MKVTTLRNDEALPRAREARQSWPQRAGGVLRVRDAGYGPDLAERCRALEKQNRNLQGTVRRLRQLALVDGLTGLANRRYFEFALQAEIGRAAREGAPVSLILADVDNFKRINDDFGHQTGDLVLSLVAGVLPRHCRRGSDLGARYGGEEFAVLLGRTPAGQAIEMAERLRGSVEELAIPGVPEGAQTPLTMSFGVTTFRACKPCSPRSLIDAADDALYRAKEAGRNRTRYASPAA